ncbi:MAG: bifunctional [glutamine synthetase] adenylyltransferase/[glutamine synthetase]-adenylyl-L-tyrosine phosphorylase [Micromonosporaceae bacterium]|nr:bifunctional [glutamine synthetase] adenylyltransferase/[glutamine synthetase]-adenylyl-L-tyrosine phosphorylase [Micromonosporaceae bacterium]
MASARRPGTSTAKLARYGFSDADRAAAALGGLGLWHPVEQRPVDEAAAEVLAGLSRAADPDLAARQMQRLAEADGDTLARVREQEPLRTALTAVLGASAALGDHLVACPGEWVALADAPAEPPSREQVRARLREAVDGSTGPEAVLRLRLAYRRALLGLAAADLTGQRDVEQVMAELSDLADATLDAALAVAAAECGGTAARCRLAVVAMGKCGAQELNYVSDVDVIFVAEPCEPDLSGDAAGGPVSDAEALATASGLASRMMEICRLAAWPVDAALRPEGKDGPLVRTLASHVAYYRRWARTWEFQALLKARPAAGDIALGERWLAEIRPLVWRAADRPGVVEDVRAMRRKVEEQLPTRYADREIKLGPGGLRDIEFAVQLLQLVHGRGDESLRAVATLDALRALIGGGYVGRGDGEQLADSYRFLRTVEHRLQLQRLRRTHRVPDDAAALRWLAQSLGYRASPRRDAVGEFHRNWSEHASRVRRLHEKLLYRPVLEAVAKVPTDALRLGPDSARQRLEVLGFADPAGALRHIEALTSGVSRTAAIQRTLLPMLLSEFADAPEPDRGLLGYRTVSDTLGSTPWYLRLLRDEGPVALRMARLLALSRYVTDLLARDPEALRLLVADAELRPRPREVLVAGMAAAARRHDDPSAAVRGVRALRRRELFRIAASDLLGLADVTVVGAALADLTDAVLAAASAAASRSVFGDAEPPARLAVIGMGRLGGLEMSYPSDADVIFVHEPAAGASDEAAAEAARQVAERLRALLSAPAPDPPLGVDAGLRPEGRGGPLTRSLEAYQQYYRRWAGAWEAQALLRARFVCGDAELGERFAALADPCRYPRGGLTPAQVTEIRRIKARVEHERLPRGADPATHTKLGRGGLADVEWTVQLLQLRHGHDVAGLRTPRTLDALDSARGAGLLDAADAEALRAAWLLATRVRNAITLVRGRPSDQLPRRGPELAGVALALGWPAGSDSDAFRDDYLRAARRARHVMERVFYA